MNKEERLEGLLKRTILLRRMLYDMEKNITKLTENKKYYKQTLDIKDTLEQNYINVLTEKRFQDVQNKISRIDEEIKRNKNSIESLKEILAKYENECRNIGVGKEMSIQDINERAYLRRLLQGEIDEQFIEILEEGIEELDDFSL